MEEVLNNHHSAEDRTGMLMMSFFKTLNIPFNIEMAVLKNKV